jgi:hypothetical protein
VPFYPVTLLQEPPRQLLESLVTRPGGFIAYGRDVGPQRPIPPVVSRGLLGVAGDAIARSLQQRLRRGGIEAGVIAWRQVELATRTTGIVSIIIDERAGQENAQGWVLSGWNCGSLLLIADR